MISSRDRQTTPYLSGEDVTLLLQVCNPLGQCPIVQSPGVDSIVGSGKGFRQTLDGYLKLLEMLHPLRVLHREDLLGPFQLW